jgi:hypothetical protein
LANGSKERDTFVSAKFDPTRALRVLQQHGVNFIVVGGMAATALGSPSITFDLDICYERSPSNHARLAEALRELHASLRGAPAGLPFLLDGRTITNGDSFTFDTDVGPLDCLGTPAGTKGYADLLCNASEVDFPDGLVVRVAALDDLLRMKRAAGRAKDRIQVEILEALKEERAKLL